MPLEPIKLSGQSPGAAPGKSLTQVFSRNKDGNTLLIIAVKSPDRDVAALLLANNEDVNAGGQGRVVYR